MKRILRASLSFSLPIIFFVCAVLFALTMPPPASADVGGINLSGAWLAGNKGFFYITHVGDEIWWYGEDDPIDPTWSQIGHGRMTGKTITVDWINVPKGNAMMKGTVVFEVTFPDRMVLKSETGNHFGMKWMTMTQHPDEEN